MQNTSDFGHPNGRTEVLNPYVLRTYILCLSIGSGTDVLDTSARAGIKVRWMADGRPVVAWVQPPYPTCEHVPKIILESARLGSGEKHWHLVTGRYRPPRLQHHLSLCAVERARSALPLGTQGNSFFVFCCIRRQTPSRLSIFGFLTASGICTVDAKRLMAFVIKKNELILRKLKCSEKN